MKYSKPYYVIGKMFIQTYHGGGCNSEQLRKNKRGKIRKFSHASQKRLCLFVESYSYLRFSFSITINTKKEESQKKIISITKTLSSNFFSKDCIPFFIWKKRIVENEVEYKLITNGKFKFTCEELNFYFNHKYTNTSFNINNISNKNKYLYDFAIEAYESTEEASGRFWGAINRNSYPPKKQKKKLMNIKEILLQEVQLNSIPFSKKGLYYRKK